jgi:hypothetical protein
MEERNAGFSGDCPSKESLSCARGANQQHAFRQLPTQSRKFLRILEEFHHILQLLFRLICLHNKANSSCDTSIALICWNSDRAHPHTALHIKDKLKWN